MKDTGYFKQARLLLQVLPFIEKAGGFALKGGTAINLFVREMPRFSVDIDLTYIPMNTRDEALTDISRSSWISWWKRGMNCFDSSTPV